MADQTVLPTPVGNHCLGKHYDGSIERRLRCVKTHDANNAPVYNCTTSRYFRVNCSKINQQCSSLSGAWVAASTVCSQKLF